MGHMNYIFGYIRAAVDEDEFNKQRLRSFEYDELWPLPNVFHLSADAKCVPMISFGMAFNSTDEDWTDWFPRFEYLLGRLHALTARVVWEREDFGDLFSVEYVCSDPSYPGQWAPEAQRQWIKIVSGQQLNGIEIGEINLIL